MQRAFTSFLFSTLPLATFGCLTPLSTQAQVTPDGTTSTAVNQDGNNFTIEQGDRLGDNLFHSFNEFSVPTGGSAGFNNAADIANIFSRVTGGNISNIDGLLSANGTANLYLINPNGIIFGENARLDLGGSFFASTADSLLFEGDTEFSANSQAAPLLVVSIPTGASFRDNPGDIINRSFAQNSVGDFAGLEVSSGNNLTLLGGDLNFEAGNVTAREGNIYLGGLSQAGIVDLSPEGILSFPENLTKSNITLSNFADVNVQGTGGGSITINAQNLTLEAGEFGSSLIRGGISSDSTSVEAQAGDIDINVAENITLNGSSIENNNSRGLDSSAGNIVINTGSLEATNGGVVLTSTSGRGNGNIDIIATGDITFDGSRIAADKLIFTPFINSETNGGDITITTNSLSIINEGIINTSSSGSASTSQDPGRAGNIKITASKSVLINNASLSSTNNIIAGGNRDFPDNSTIFNLGSIEIDSPILKVMNGGFIETSPDLVSFLQTSSADILINASELLELSRGSISSGTFGFDGLIGSAGDITIETTNLRIDKGRISALSSLVEPMGDSINAGNLAISAGNLAINTQDLILKNGSSITAQALGFAGGGNVNIDADDGFILAFPNGNNDITANASQGNGGNININTQAVFGLEERSSTPPNQTNDIDASSEFGLQGDFSLNTPDFDPTTGLINLPASVGDASDQISQNSCEQGVGSEFTVTGKGGLPPTVSESVNSESTQVGLIEPVPSGSGGAKEQGSRGEVTQIDNTSTEAIPAQGWVFNDRGEVTLTAYSTSDNKIKRAEQQYSSSCQSEILH